MRNYQGLTVHDAYSNYTKRKALGNPEIAERAHEIKFFFTSPPLPRRRWLTFEKIT
ncbi:hypothetical protein EDC27_2617 [Desulfosoma caldarium]|uniref:Uncharacterized protein n=1 Tax=Desulfosoma caldarium TaxID=610254 RepID=A0A3N1UQB5_9BACT|nr:hypothetical protein EDC27_2617 [Desulfosoma caldarium]